MPCSKIVETKWPLSLHHGRAYRQLLIRIATWGFSIVAWGMVCCQTVNLDIFAMLRFYASSHRKHYESFLKYQSGIRARPCCHTWLVCLSDCLHGDDYTKAYSLENIRKVCVPQQNHPVEGPIRDGYSEHYRWPPKSPNLMKGICR